MDCGLLKTLYFALQGIDLFGNYGVDKMVIFSMISVHEDMGGKGVGTNLAVKSEEFLAQNRPDIKLIVGETTGGGSAKIFQRQGFQKLSEIEYDSYLNGTGEPIFRGIPNPPHRGCIVWAKPV